MMKKMYQFNKQNKSNMTTFKEIKKYWILCLIVLNIFIQKY